MTLTAAQRQLVESHMPAAQKMATDYLRHVPPHADRDGIRGAAYLGLCEAAARFDPSRGAAFGAYAQRRIYGAMNDFARAQTPLLPHRSRAGKQPTQSPMPRLCAADDPTAEAEQRDEIDHLLRGLSRYARLVLELFGAGLPRSVIADALGVSTSRVFQIRNEAFALIRAREP